MPWMENKHDDCPCCRVKIITPCEIRLAASNVLEKRRTQELSDTGRKIQGNVFPPPALMESASSQTTIYNDVNADGSNSLLDSAREAIFC